jgi:hypothetical protein
VNRSVVHVACGRPTTLPESLAGWLADHPLNTNQLRCLKCEDTFGTAGFLWIIAGEASVVPVGLGI